MAWLVTCLDRQSEIETEFNSFSDAMKYFKRCIEEGWEKCSIEPLAVDTEAAFESWLG